MAEPLELETIRRLASAKVWHGVPTHDVSREVVEALIDEVERLTDDLSVNVRLLARQCDLAREAETERDRLRAKLKGSLALLGAIVSDASGRTHCPFCESETSDNETHESECNIGWAEEALKAEAALKVKA